MDGIQYQSELKDWCCCLFVYLFIFVVFVCLLYLFVCFYSECYYWSKRISLKHSAVY